MKDCYLSKYSKNSVCTTVSSSIVISLRLGYPAAGGISLGSREISQYSPLYYSYCMALQKLGKIPPTMIGRGEMDDDNPWTMTMVSPTPSRSRGVGRCTRKDSARRAQSLLERMRRRRRQQLRSQIARPQTGLQVVKCHHQHCGALERSGLRQSRPLAPQRDGEAVQHGRFRLHPQRPHVLCRYLRLLEQQQEAF